MGPGMSFDLALVQEMAPEIIRAFGLTVLTWIGGVLGALVLGFAVALLRRDGPRPLGWLLLAYVELMRGTPFLIQLFLLYYGGPSIGLSLDPVPAGLLGLSLYGGAYFSEIFRTGFEAVPPGHIEAGECAGLTRRQIMARVILPEMTMLVLPALVNMVIILLKETAMLSLITVQELTMVVSVIGTQKYAFMTAMGLLALFYWALVELSGALGAWAESRLSRFRFAAA